MSDSSSVKVDPVKTSLLNEYQHDRPLTCCDWEPRSRSILFGAEDYGVHELRLSDGEISSQVAHDSWVRGLATSPDGEWYYSAGYDGRLGLWSFDEQASQPVRLIEAHQGWVRAVAVSSDGQYLATCGNDKRVKLWDAAEGRLIKTWEGHTSHVYNVVFAPDAPSVYSCDLKGTVYGWTLDASEPRHIVTAEILHGYDKTFRADIGGARGIALHADGHQLALGGISKVTNAFAGVGEVAIALVDIQQGKVERVFQSKDKTGGVMWGVAYHPQGFWIGLSGGRGGGWLWFWKGDSEQEFHKLKLKNDGRGMSLSPDGLSVAVAHADKHLRTYSLASA